MSRFSQRQKESYIVALSCIVLLTLICFVIRHVHTTFKYLSTPPFEVELVKDISSDQNVIQLTTSKYLEEGEYHIIFEVVGSTQTIVKDKDEFSYQNWLEVPLSKENTYYYTLDGEYSGAQIIKITISGEKNRKDFIIPFEVR
jgi:hypothetical protein